VFYEQWEREKGRQQSESEEGLVESDVSKEEEQSMDVCWSQFETKDFGKGMMDAIETKYSEGVCGDDDDDDDDDDDGSEEDEEQTEEEEEGEDEEKKKKREQGEEEDGGGEKGEESGYGGEGGGGGGGGGGDSDEDGNSDDSEKEGRKKNGRKKKKKRKESEESLGGGRTKQTPRKKSPQEWSLAQEAVITLVKDEGRRTWKEVVEEVKKAHGGVPLWKLLEALDTIMLLSKRHKYQGHLLPLIFLAIIDERYKRMMDVYSLLDRSKDLFLRFSQCILLNISSHYSYFFQAVPP